MTVKINDTFLMYYYYVLFVVSYDIIFNFYVKRSSPVRPFFFRENWHPLKFIDHWLVSFLTLKKNLMQLGFSP